MINDIIDIVVNFKKTNILTVIVASVILVFTEIISISIFLPLFYLLFNQENQYLNTFFTFLNNNNLIFIDVFTTTLFFALLIFVLRFIISSLLNFFIINYKTSIQKFFANHALKFFLKKNYLELKKINNNELLIFTSRETEKFANTVESLVNLFTDLLIIFLILGLLIFQEPYISFILSLLVITFFGIYRFIFKPYIKIWGEKHQFHDIKRTTTLNEIFSLIREIKIFGVSKDFRKKFSYDNSRTQIAQRNRVYFFSFVKAFVEVIIITIFIGSILAIHYSSKNFVDFLPIFSFFFVAMLRIYPLINRSINNLQMLEFCRKSVEFHKLLSKFIKQKKLNNLTYNSKKEIFNNKKENILSLKNLNFSYESKKIFKNLNVAFKDNSIIGIEGESGDGKTTLVEILLGLIEPQKGHLLINNVDIKKHKDKWFKNVSYVSQDNTLFNGSILQNITFQLEDKKNDKFEVLKLIKNLNKNFYNKFKNKINYTINYSASNLSLGEKQRISIARGLFKGKKIIVLDEITSSLDRENERQVLDEIKKFKKNRLIIIISHKRSSLKICDQIYRIKDFSLKKVKFHD